ncbi:hypothetical protein [Pseudomonas alkylphenolica]|uniref:hypothetical protein n=1 Tax=Pseudomonas alkylphenolica TaxID=237609 RepID=UPI00315CA8D9
MATHRERSFIASVASESGSLGYFGQLHTERLLNPFHNFSWFVPSGDYYASHVLGHVREPRAIPKLLWYFRSTDAGYVIFVRSQLFFGRFIGFRKSCLGALSTKEDGRSTFRFDPDIGAEPRLGDEIVTRLISLDTGKPLCLRDKHFRYRVTKHNFESKGCTYIAADGGAPFKLRLKIVQTNVPYLDNPNEV